MKLFPSNFSIVPIIVLTALGAEAFGQTITLEKCIEAAQNNFPLLANQAILDQLFEYTVENVYVGKKPQVNIVAQGTYQSDVTRIPIDNPLFKVPVLAKDQYRTYAEMSQSIYDGGTMLAAATLQQKQTAVEKQALEVELYKLKERVVQLYFGALLAGKQIDQTSLLVEDLDAVLKKIDHTVEEGVVLKINADMVRAERIRILQRQMEQSSIRKTWINALEMLTGLQIQESDILNEPEPPVVIISETRRPEINLFARQSDLINQQLSFLLSKNSLKAGAFLQAGYGRPGLNMLVNQFDTYYLTGLRLSWNVSGYWTSKSDRQMAGLRMNMVENQRKVFELNNAIQQRQYFEEASRLDKLKKLDEELILLRYRILETVKIQLENGVVTASDFIRESNALDQAKLSLILHDIQRAQIGFNHKMLVGD